MKWLHAGWVLGLVMIMSGNVYGKTGEKIVIENGKKVKINFTLTVNGEMVDSTPEGEPFEYTQGQNQIIPGLESQLIGLKAGDERDIVIGPEDGFGVIDPKAFVEVAKSRLPEGDVEVGMQLEATGPDGRKLQVTVSEVKPDSVVLDFNHPLAGKELHFKVKVVEIL